MYLCIFFEQARGLERSPSGGKGEVGGGGGGRLSVNQTTWTENNLALVVQRVMDNAFHRINHYPVDSVVLFVLSSPTYPLDSDLSSG